MVKHELVLGRILALCKDPCCPADSNSGIKQHIILQGNRPAEVKVRIVAHEVIEVSSLVRRPDVDV
jgi:hypothetical protein